MNTIMFYYLLVLFVLLNVQNSLEQHLLGTHFYVNQENVLIDNTLKTVSTLARPYDLVAFIRQSERLARVDYLQTFVDDAEETSTSSSLNSDKQDKEESPDKCHEFIREGESLIFQILQSHLYDTFHIPLELKGLSINSTINEKKSTKILTCNHFCQVKTSKKSLDLFIEFLLVSFKVCLPTIIYPVFPHVMMNKKCSESKMKKQILRRIFSNKLDGQWKN